MTLPRIPDDRDGSLNGMLVGLLVVLAAGVFALLAWGGR